MELQPRTLDMSSLFQDILKILQESRQNVAIQVNVQLLNTYWNIGRVIIEFEQKNHIRAEYGAETLTALAKALTAEFGKGFSKSNLYNMRQFYITHKIFQSVTCLVDNRICVLVPELLFNKADQTKYLEFSHQIQEGYTIVSEPLASAQCHLVFAMPKALQDKVLAQWETAKITHSSGVFIESAMQNPEKHDVFVNIRSRDFDMVVKKEDKLHFFNNFKYNTKEDFAYFLLFAMEQNGCSGQDTSVCCSGLIRPDSEIIDLCGRYVKDIRFVENSHYFIHYQALR